MDAATMNESEKDGDVVGEIARMRVQAPTWNLAGDHSLLQLMEKMHENIIYKAKATNAKMDNLFSQLNDADVYLNNVNNRFMALSNTQFVENRVYDDDVEVGPVDQKKDSENEIISKDQEASKERNDIDRKELDLQATASALATLESYHKHIRIMPDSDSDSDESGTGISMANSLVLRPKDLYEQRPLPHIIGSEQWKAKWHVGLVEEDSSSESDGEHQRSAPLPEQFSSSEDATDDETIRTASERGEMKEKITLPLRGKLGKDKESSESGNDDMTSDISERVESTRGHAHQDGNTTETYIKPQSTATASNFAAELARRLGAPLPPQSDSGAPVAPSSIPEEPKPSAKSYAHKQKGQVVGNIFSDEPPPLDQINDYDHPMTEDWDADSQDENDIFADLRGTSKQLNTNTNILNSGVTANKYDDLFADILQPEEKKIDRKVEPIKSNVTKDNVGNLFDSDSDSGDIFAAIPTRSDILPKGVVPKIVPELKGGLFDDDSDSGDLFSTKTSPKKTFLKPTAVKDDKIQAVTPKSVNMFSESDDDSPVPTKEHNVYKIEDRVNKKPKGGVSLFQGNDTNIAAAILKHKPRVSSSSDSSDCETVEKSNKSNIDKQTNISQQLKQKENIPKDIPEVEADTIFRDTKINEIFKPEIDNYDLISNTSKNVYNSKENENYNIEDEDIFSKDDNLFSKDIREDDLFSQGTKDLFPKQTKDIKDKKILSKESKPDIDNNQFSKHTKDNDIFSKDIEDKLFSEDTEGVISKETKVKDESIFSRESKHDIKDNNLVSKDIRDDNLSSEDNLFSEQSKDNGIDLFSGKSEESKPEIRTKPQLPKPENAKKKETITNKVKSDDKTVTEANNIVEDCRDLKPKNSKLEMNKNLSPNLFSDDEPSISEDDFDNIFHSEPPEFKPEQTNNSLFYDDDDDAYDIFSNNAGFKAVPPKDILFGDEIPEASKRKVAIFDDEPPDFDDNFNSLSNKKKTADSSLEINKKREMITKKSSEATTYLKNSAVEQSGSEPKRAVSTDDIFNSSAEKAEVVNNLDSIFNDSENMFKTELNAKKTGTIFGESSDKKHAEKKSIFQYDDDELFQPSPHHVSPTVDIKKDNFAINSEDKLMSGQKSSIDTISKFDSSQDDASLKKNDTIKKTEGIAEEHESKMSPTRVVGKLKPSTLKINVNSLKPGAIPKFSTKSVESNTNPTVNREEIDGRIIKSVSFDESTNPSVLANMSKNRPRIQVKRKPSTRKGRQDTLRNSVIGLHFEKELSLSNNAVDSYVYSLPTSPQEVKSIEDSLRSVRYGSDHKIHDISRENISNEKQDNITSNEPIKNDQSNISDNIIDKPIIISNKPSITTIKPNITSDKPHMSIDKPNITSDKPNITSDKGNITGDKSSILSDKLNISTDKVDIGIDKPDVSSDKPNVGTDNANIPSDKPNMTSDKLYTGIANHNIHTSDKPNTTINKPMFDKSNITSDEPNIRRDELNISTEKVDTGVDKPNISTNIANNTSDKHNNTSKKPNITSDKPNISTDSVNITSEKHNITSDNLVITNEKANNSQNITSKNIISNDDPDITNKKAGTICVEISTSNKTGEIFKSVINDEIEDLVNVNTLGQTYKDDIKNEPHQIDSFEKPVETDNIFFNKTSDISKTSSKDLFNDLFKPNLKQPVTNTSETIDSTEESVSKMPISKGNLFDDTQNSEDQLFASKKEKKNTKKMALLFADDFDDENLFGAKHTQKSTLKTLPISQNKPEAQTTDLSNKEKNKKKELGMKEAKSTTLFSDSDSEDWFESKFEKVKIKAKPEKSDAKMAECDLFSSDKKSVFSKETPKNLFADGDDESDIFGDTRKQASSSKLTFETIERMQPQTTTKTQSVPSSAEQVFKDPLSSFDND